MKHTMKKLLLVALIASVLACTSPACADELDIQAGADTTPSAEWNRASDARGVFSYDNSPANAAVLSGAQNDLSTSNGRRRPFGQRISGNIRHAVMLRSDGTVITKGQNLYNECNTKDWTDIVEVSAGAAHTVGLRSDGTVVATGHNGDGECDIGEWSNIVQVSAGRGYTVGLRLDGTAVAVGDNYSGECNVQDWTDIVKVSAGTDFTLGLRRDGTVVETFSGSKPSKARETEKWTDIVDIAAGVHHAVGLRSDGTVVAAYNNEMGQCDTENWSDIVAVSASFWYTAGLKADGTVVMVGELGDDDLGGDGYGLSFQDRIANLKNIVQIACGEHFLLALDDQGVVQSIGQVEDSFWGPYIGTENWRDIVKVVSSGDYTVGLRSNGTVVGRNVDTKGWKNVIDINLLDDYEGDYLCVALCVDGTVLATVGYDDPDIDVDGWTNIVSVWMDRETIVGLRGDGTVVACGNNDEGQCETADWKDIVAVRTGFNRTVGLRRDGTVVATGYNRSGECETSDWSDIIDIELKESGTFGLRGDGSVVATPDKKTFKKWKNVKAIKVITNYADYIIGLREDGSILVDGGRYNGGCENSEWTNIVDVFANGEKIVGLRGDGTVVAVDSGVALDTADWTDVVDIKAFLSGVVGLRKDGTVVMTVEQPDYGEPYDTSDWTDVIAIKAINDMLFGVRRDGTVLTTSTGFYDVSLSSDWTNIADITGDGDMPSTIVGLKTDGTIVAVGKDPCDDENLW